MEVSYPSVPNKPGWFILELWHSPGVPEVFGGRDARRQTQRTLRIQVRLAHKQLSVKSIGPQIYSSLNGRGVGYTAVLHQYPPFRSATCYYLAYCRDMQPVDDGIAGREQPGLPLLSSHLQEMRRGGLIHHPS